MQVDHHVETSVAQPSAEREIVTESLPPACASGQHDLVQARVMPDDGRGCRLDQIRQVGFRIRTAQGADDRRGEHHVANQSQPHHQNPHGGDYTADGPALDRERRRTG